MPEPAHPTEASAARPAAQEEMVDDPEPVHLSADASVAPPALAGRYLPP